MFQEDRATHRAWSAFVCLAVLLTTGCVPDDDQRTFEAWIEVDRKTYGLRAAVAVEDAPAGDDELAGQVSLDACLAYAQKRNPALEAAFDRWKAALERVLQVRSLPDPRFHYRYFIENVETRVGPQRHSVGLSQTFPWFGKLDLRGGVAMAAARAAQARYEAEKLKLVYRVKKAYHEYYYLAQAIAVVQENRELVIYLEEVARARFKTAEARHPDVIRAQVELGKLDDRLRTLENLRGPTAARLNALLNRPTQSPLAWPGQIAEESIAVDDRQLFDWLAEDNPELVALRHQAALQRESVRLDRKGRYPDLTVGVTYIDTGRAVMPGVSDSGNDPVSVGVSINLPIWHEKYDAAIRESLAEFGAATKTLADRKNALEADLRTAIYRFHDARRKINLYRDTLVPKAKQSIKATEAAFRAGTAGFIDLIDAERVLLEFQLAHERALADSGSRLAEIEMLVGRTLGPPSDPAAPLIDQRPPGAPDRGGHRP